VALETDGEYQLDRSVQKLRSTAKSQGGQEYSSNSIKEDREAGLATACSGTAF